MEKFENPEWLKEFTLEVLLRTWKAFSEINNKYSFEEFVTTINKYEEEEKSNGFN